jgi:hypothetical protein
MKFRGEKFLEIKQKSFEIDSRDLLQKLSQERRTEIGLSQVIDLPNNFSNIDEISKQPFNEEAIHLHKILRENKIQSELLEDKEHRPVLELRGFEVILPPILLLATDPTVQAFVINILSNYIYDKIKKLSEKQKEQTPIALEVVKTSDKGNLVSIKYSGSAKDFETISKHLKKDLGVDFEK